MQAHVEFRTGDVLATKTLMLEPQLGAQMLWKLTKFTLSKILVSYLENSLDSVPPSNCEGSVLPKVKELFFN